MNQERYEQRPVHGTVVEGRVLLVARPTAKSVTQPHQADKGHRYERRDDDVCQVRRYVVRKVETVQAHGAEQVEVEDGSERKETAEGLRELDV